MIWTKTTKMVASCTVASLCLFSMAVVHRLCMLQLFFQWFFFHCTHIYVELPNGRQCVLIDWMISKVLVRAEWTLFNNIYSMVWFGFDFQDESTVPIMEDWWENRKIQHKTKQNVSMRNVQWAQKVLRVRKYFKFLHFHHQLASESKILKLSFFSSSCKSAKIINKMPRTCIQLTWVTWMYESFQSSSASTYQFPFT